MSTNTAIVVHKKGEARAANVSIPKLRDDYIIVNVKAIALNPTDWKHVDFIADPGARIGCDMVGTVEQIGSKVTKDLKIGDRVTGFVHGGNQIYHEDGAFAEYVTAKGDIMIKIPSNLSDAEAATLGVGITTVGQSLYQSLKLPLPTKPSTASPKPILLIYGGSTATGTLAIQYAKLSGYSVVTTSSEHNFEYLKSLGADATFDYKSPTCSQDIKKWSKGSVKHALDCISEEPSASITVAAMSSTGGAYTSLLPIPAETISKINPCITNNSTLGYTVVGEYFKFGTQDFPAKPEDFEFGKMFWEMSRGLLESGKVKVHKPSVDKYGSGFEGILKGMEAMKQGKVSGEKLVFTIS